MKFTKICFTLFSSLYKLSEAKVEINYSSILRLLAANSKISKRSLTTFETMKSVGDAYS